MRSTSLPSLTSSIGSSTGVTNAENRPATGCTSAHFRECDSPNRHAIGYAQATGHPVIASAEPANAGCIAIRTTPSTNKNKKAH
jgi:hypothetical protein